MKALLSILIFSLIILTTGCAKIKNLVNKPQKKTAIENIEKEKTYGNWSDSLSGIVCITGGIIIIYDDLLGSVSEGSYDNLANGFKWKDRKNLELINSSLETIANKTIYNFRYKSGVVHIRQRATYGENDQHSAWEHWDAEYTKKGYIRMIGEISIGGQVSNNSSACWGLNPIARLENLMEEFDKEDSNL